MESQRAVAFDILDKYLEMRKGGRKGEGGGETRIRRRGEGGGRGRKGRKQRVGGGRREGDEGERKE